MTALNKLSPEKHIHIKEGKITKTKYYNFEQNLDFEQWDGKEDEEIKAIVKAKLIECINLRLRADVKRGFNLSGGVDSTLMFSLIKDQLAPEKHQCL
jgi:asparagine synthase (glutamine-hydrolysing)